MLLNDFWIETKHERCKNLFSGNQAGSIISDIQTITEDVKIGFGSFVDKNLPPFARSEISS